MVEHVGAVAWLLRGASPTSPERTGELRRLCHLTVDALIMADDALDCGDIDTYRAAIEIISAHAASLRAAVKEIGQCTE